MASPDPHRHPATRPISDAELEDLIVALGDQTEHDGDELLADFLVHTHPTLRSQLN